MSVQAPLIDVDLIRRFGPTAPLTTRLLTRAELDRLQVIDRREQVHEIYVADAHGRLTLTPFFHDTRGWPDGELEAELPILRRHLDQGGAAVGVFDHHALIGAAVLVATGVGDYPDLRQLVFLHVGHDWRGRGVASALYRLCAEAARRGGASGLYISATSTRRTVDFYQRLGAVPTARPDKALFRHEPDDIHLIHRFL